MASALAPELALRVAQAILAVHVASAAFIIGGVGAIALGRRLGWRWTRDPWWRLAHVVALGIVVVQKLLGQTCFLSVWEQHFLAIAQHGEYRVPVVHAIADDVIHVPLPLSFAVTVYTAVWCLLVVLWLRLPGRPPARA